MPSSQGFYGCLKDTKILKRVIEELKQKGVKEGQSIVIGEMEFEFFE